jgi:putative MATE family efflux protein
MNHNIPIDERWNNRALFSLIWPLVIEQLLAVSIGATDIIMVSSVGEHAVSGVNIIENVNFLLMMAFISLCTGGAVVASQYIGRRDYANSRLAAKQLVYSVMIISLVILLFPLFFRRQLIGLIYGSIAPDVMDAAAVYFLFTGMAYPFLALYYANTALFRAMGNSKAPMHVALFMNILHIIGNIVLIYGLKMGVMGAALSTLACRITAAVITTTMLYRDNHSPISLSGLFKVRIVPPMIKNILNVGIPGAIENSMFQVGRLLTQRIFTIYGTVAIAANATAAVINSYLFMPGLGFGFALLTVVGQCIGAGNYAEAKKQTFNIMKYSYITLVITSVVIYICIGSLVSLFNLSAESQEMAKTFLRIQCVTMALGYPMSFSLPNALRAAGDARYVMIVAVISMWTVRVSAAYLLTFALGLGPAGVWLAMGGDFFIRGALYGVRWARGKWQGMRVIDD